MRKLKLLFMICLLGQTVFGQEEGRLNEPNIIPPSPTAYSLGKYGMIPVNMATGAINQSIPITVIKSKYLEVPVTLSYSTNGFKVDETASWVGQGWNLMAGGVITRVIRDEPDAGTNYPYPADITNEGDFEALEYIERANQASFDSEPDLYTFNFMGNSGSFVFERYNSPVLMPYQNIKIDREIDKTTGDDWFYITTPDGVKYTFGGNNAIEKSKITTGGAGCGKSYNSFEKTAWYLIKITHPTGDEITFEYESQTKNYISSVSQTVTKLIGSSGCSGTCPSNTNTTCESYSYTTGVVLKRIKYSDDKIEFENSARTDILQGRKLDAIKTYYDGVLYQETNLVYETTVATQYTNSYSRNARFWLKEVQEKGASTNHDKVYKFDYHNLSQVPPRFSFAQDHWGYFNAASNSDFVPTNTDIKNSLGQPLFTGIGGDREPNASVAHYGLLSKVTYPTGGYTEITYEAHDYYGTRVISGTQTNFSLDCVGVSLKGKHTETQTLEIFNNQLLVNFSVEPNNGATNQNWAELSIIEVSTGTKLMDLRKLDVGESLQTYIYPKSGEDYKIELSSYGDVVDANVNFQYYSSAATTVTENINVGGARVQKTVDTDPVTTTTQTKKYYYADPSSLTESSGRVLRTQPVYYFGSSQEISCSSGTRSCGYGNLSSHSSNNLFAYGSGHITYRKVTVGDGENFNNGYTVNEYLVREDYPGKIVYGDEIHGAPWTNFGWDNGLLEKQTVYRSNNTKVSETINSWVKDDRLETEVKGLKVQKRVQNDDPTDFIIDCDENNIHAVVRKYTCVTNHTHKWIAANFELEPVSGKFKRKYFDFSWTCIAAGNDMQWDVIIDHPCKDRDPGEQVTESRIFNNLDVLEYSNKSYWIYQDMVTTRAYDESGTNYLETVTTYHYDNIDHAQMTSQKQVSPASTRETKFYYPIDYNYSLENFETLIEDKFIFGVPVRVDQLKDNNTTGSTVNYYNDNGLLTSAYLLNSTNTTAPSFSSTTVLPNNEYELYLTLSYNATSSNLEEKLNISGVNEAYLWGYDDEKLIASVVGAPLGNTYHTSFEETGTSGTAKTGTYYHTGNYSFSGDGFTPTSTTGLVISYWYDNGSGWTYSGEVPWSNTINGYTKIDEVRVYPKGAKMSTYTYKHGKLLSSVTDPSGISKTFEYDSTGKLILVRDQDNSILTKYEFNFKQ